MPYYRIIIKLQSPERRLKGIRFNELRDIDIVHNLYKNKALALYTMFFVDIEVQMISKNCTAVRQYFKQLERSRGVVTGKVGALIK
jgi:hypothetical protein